MTKPPLLAVACLSAAAFAFAGCGNSESEDTTAASPPAPPTTINLASGTSGSPAPAPAAAAAPAPPPASSMEPEPQGFDPKEVARVVQVLDWHAENYVSKHDRIPTIEELKAWKDPNFPFPFRQWPSPPPGKKWVINPASGQFRLENQ
jgi:hypothetical protein